MREEGNLDPPWIKLTNWLLRPGTPALLVSLLNLGLLIYIMGSLNELAIHPAIMELIPQGARGSGPATGQQSAFGRTVRCRRQCVAALLARCRRTGRSESKFRMTRLWRRLAFWRGRAFLLQTIQRRLWN